MGKAPKGTVSVQVFKERLRLCWSYQGKRYFFYVGLPDSKINRIAAEQKALQIQGDMATGNFDPTLVKYKPLDKVAKLCERASAIAVTVLFERFIAYKQSQVDSRTLEKYRGLLKLLAQYFKDKSAAAVTEAIALSFKEWLARSIAPVTLKERIGLLKACWDWGIKRKLVQCNPWVEVRVRVSPKQKPRPFSKQETESILAAFKGHSVYKYYADFVEFLFSTGCRTGEAIGLRWRHLNDDCSSVWIGEIFSRGRNKPVKCDRERTLILTDKLSEMLRSRRPEVVDRDDFVFKGAEGGAIDDHNFRNRAWKPILEELNIEYRKPYTTRRTLISHALNTGMSPLLVAEMVGHDLQTLYHLR